MQGLGLAKPQQLKLFWPFQERDLLFGLWGFRLIRQQPDIKMLLVQQLMRFLDFGSRAPLIL